DKRKDRERRRWTSSENMIQHVVVRHITHVLNMSRLAKEGLSKQDLENRSVI
ncbi:hypothetical protein BDZ97DRAFT_1808853, partial [Flammula alnicola]